MTITWAQLQENKILMTSLHNSAHMLECIEVVKRKHADAKIVTVEEGKLWGLASVDTQLSGPHNSHYDCWAEARAMIEAGML